MTAAALGSRLSVAGTLVGAALASIVAAVATAIYTASLERAGSRVKNIRTTRPGATVLARPEWGDAQEHVTGGPGPTATVALTRTRAKRIGWKNVVVGALAIFAVTAAVLTGLELATGQAISGESGTTIGQVSENTAPTKPDQPVDPAATASPTATAEPSEDTQRESTEPSATATTPASAEPSPAPSASGTPTTPSASPTASGGAAPTPALSPTE